MPSSRCVVYCNSGLKSNPEKVSFFFFYFQKMNFKINKWVKSIPRKNLVVGPKTVVCEKLFE